MSDRVSCDIDRRGALVLGTGAALSTLVPFDGAAAASPNRDVFGLGREQSFDLGWRFHKGAGEGFASPGHDDRAWRVVDLPHDWSIEDLPPGPDRIGPFDKAAENGTGTGFAVGGEGWYRKRFRLAELPHEARAELLFGGVAVASEVWVNGRQVASHVNAYTPFAVDLTPHLVRGGDNVIAVRAVNAGRNTRWYSGSGLYRSVTLDVFPSPQRVARWGVAAWTRRIDANGALLSVTSEFEAADPALRLRTRLRDPAGGVVAEAISPASAKVQQELLVRSPQLWSPEQPTLHVLETELLRGSAILDRVRQSVGLRIVTMDAANGLRINGRGYKLRGGCVHHDNGILGAMAFADADDRRIRLLKARGYTALRSSHNPSSASFRAACDRHGMLLIEEAFDTWHRTKRPQDYGTHFKDHWQADLAAMVLQARNNPSVIMWSIGNEVPERATPEGMQWAERLSNAVHRLDPSRPVTAAIHSFPGRLMKVATPGGERVDYASNLFLDVVGYNYKLGAFEEDHKTFPQRVFYAAETHADEAYDYRVLAERAPYFLGEFLWTAMDYIGEAGLGLPLRVPATTGYAPVQFPIVNAWSGDLDLIGGQKPPSLYRDVVWGLSPLEMTVRRPLPEGLSERVPAWGWPDELPSWTWSVAEGQPMTVRLFTAGDKVELRLDGAVVATREVAPGDKMRVEVPVPFRPGTLEAVAYRNGAEIGRKRLETVGRPKRLRLIREERAGRADRHALSHLRIEVLDAAGRVVPDAAEPIRIAFAGPADLIGFGHGGPLATGSFQSATTQTYNGRALAILRSRGQPGSVSVTVTGGALQPASTNIRLRS
jgi:beta-galactosidase